MPAEQLDPLWMPPAAMLTSAVVLPSAASSRTNSGLACSNAEPDRLSFWTFWPHISSGIRASSALSVLGSTKLGMALLAEASADGSALGEPLGGAELAGGAALADCRTAVDADGVAVELQAATTIATIVIRPKGMVGCRIAFSIAGRSTTLPDRGYA